MRQETSLTTFLNFPFAQLFLFFVENLHFLFSIESQLFYFRGEPSHFYASEFWAQLSVNFLGLSKSFRGKQVLPLLQSARTNNH